jgi:RimJ/RimL family protein N-acetyltransferase
MAFDTLSASRVEIRCDARNAKSRAVAERRDLELEGHPAQRCVYPKVPAPDGPYAA